MRQQIIIVLLLGMSLNVLPTVYAEGITQKNQEHSDALSEAILAKNLKEIKRLIMAGLSKESSVILKTLQEKDLFYEAVRSKDAELVSFLIKHNSRNSSSEALGVALGISAYQQDFKTAQLLLQSGANPNAFYSGKYPPPLISAAKNGNLNLVILLLEQGASPHLKVDKDNPYISFDLTEEAEDLSEIQSWLKVGRTAFGFAVAYGHSDLVKLLIKAGSDPLQKDD